MELIQEI
jgi:hypothetical protein